MNTQTKVHNLSPVSLEMDSDWSKGELLDTKVTIISPTAPFPRTYLCTIAGADIKQFLRTFKLMLKTFSI